MYDRSDFFLAYLPAALLLALRPPFPFRQAQYVQVFPLKPAPFCKLSNGFGSTYKSATSLLQLSLSYLLHHSFYLNLSGGSGRNCLLIPPVLSGYNGSPNTCSSREAKQLISWLDEKRSSCPLQSHVVSLLSYPLLSDWRRSVSSKFLDTQAPSLFIKELLLAACSLVFAATDTTYC